MSLVKERKLEEFINVFDPIPLTEDTFDFYQKTAKERNNRPVEFHEELYRKFNFSKSYVRYLVVGHSGCGKSTELNKLKAILNENNHNAILIDAKTAFDVNNISYIDLIVNIAFVAIKHCEEINLNINKHLIDALRNALSTQSFTNEEDSSGDVTIESGAGIDTGKSLFGIISFLSKLTSTLKFGYSQKKQLHTEIEANITDIINAVNAIFSEISENTNKKPVLIVDGFEKCNLEQTKKLYIDGSSIFSSLKLHLVMCCPIGVQRSSESRTISGYFEYIPMPMIKINKKPINSVYRKNDEGVKVLKELVLKRVYEDSFEEGTLEYIIEKTGGCLRDLTDALRNIGFNSYLFGKQKIERNICEEYFTSLRTEIFLRIDKDKDLYPIVKKIYEGDHLLSNNDKLSELLFSGAVFEYNCERWCDLHPLIRDYIDINGVDCLND